MSKWRFNNLGPDASSVSIGHDGLAVVTGYDHKHNAIKIAAAPELFAACMATVGPYLNGDGKLNSDAPNYARRAFEALSKAYKAEGAE
jgi:hypothetical protein